MYKYEDHRPAIFTDSGQRGFLETRDRVAKMLKSSGAFQLMSALGTGCSWTQMSSVDRLVELGEIAQIPQPADTAAQHRVFVRAGR